MGVFIFKIYNVLLHNPSSPPIKNTLSMPKVETDKICDSTETRNTNATKSLKISKG